MQVNRGCAVQNAVIVAKVTEQLRARFFMTVKNKPINKTMSELIETLNYEELLVDTLSRMPALVGNYPNALAVFQDMQERLGDGKFERAYEERKARNATGMN